MSKTYDEAYAEYTVAHKDMMDAMYDLFITDSDMHSVIYNAVSIALSAAVEMGEASV